MSEINKKFKLVLGLGNNSFEQISRLCEIYSQAGADIFDLSPNVDSLKAARKGVLKAGLNPDDFQYCISIGVKGDRHIKKAVINEKKCKKCFKCIKVCPQDAIIMDCKYPKVIENKCIGCRRCEKSCIDFYDVDMDINKIAKAFNNLSDAKIDMVELHVSSDNKSDIVQNWELILKHFDCKKSICIDRGKYGDIKLLKLVSKLLAMNPEKTIIQADGIAMSGSADKSSTLQAVAHAQIYGKLDAEIFISGGTNHYTKALADEMGVRFDGITVGSYAREAVKNVADNSTAVEIAKTIINSVKS